MESKNINFSVLDSSDIFKDKKPPLNHLTEWLPQPLRLIAQLVLLPVIVILFFGTALVVFFIVAVAFAYRTWLGVLLGGLLAPGLVLLYKRQQRIDKTARVGLRDFARQNDWTYGPVGKLIQQFHNDKFIQSANENNVTLYSIKGKFRGHDFELLVGWKVTKNDPLEPLTPELFIKSQKQLPNAVLVSRHLTDGSKVFDRMFVAYDKPTPVSLEGNFDKFFQLYIPKGEQIDALSLIAPDFMQTVITFSSTLTIETSNNGFALLPIYAEALTKQSVIDMFTAAEKILAETDY